MFYIKKYYRKFLIILIPILVIILLIFFNQEKESEIIIEESIMKIKENEIENINNHKINIKGAVVNPGVYEFKDGERVIDAIKKSGGLLENADTSVINLSKNLFDEMVIVIYTFDEVSAMKNNNIIVQYVETECNCPELKNDACLTQNDVNYTDDNVNNVNTNNNNFKSHTFKTKLYFELGTSINVWTTEFIGNGF